MTREKLTAVGLLTFAATIAVFLIFGDRAGIRFAGLVGIAGCVQALRKRRFGVGIDGYEPSFYLTGRTAIVLSALALLFFIALVVVPELFVPR